MDTETAVSYFHALQPEQAALHLQEIIMFLRSPEGCLLNLSALPLDYRLVLRQLFPGINYGNESRILSFLRDRDPELAGEVDHWVPQIFDFHLLQERHKRRVLRAFSPSELITFRSLFVFPDGTNKDENEVQNLRVYFIRHLERPLLREVRKLLRNSDRPPTAVEADNLVAKYRRIYYEIEASTDSLSWFTGGHPDPSVQVFSYRATVVPTPKGFEATLLGLLAPRAEGKTMKAAIKALGDALAVHITDLLQKGMPIPPSSGGTTQIGIAVHNGIAFNHWHPTEDHVLDLDI